MSASQPTAGSASSTLVELRPAAALRRRAPVQIPHAIFFVLGLGAFLSVHLVGYVSFTELMAVCAVFGLGARGWLKNFGREMKLLLWAGGLWAVTAIATDVYRNVELAFMLRGTGRLIAFLMILVTFYVLIRARPSGLVWLLGGMVLSSVINIFFFRTGEAELVYMTGQAIETNWERNYTMVTLMLGFWLAAYLFVRRPVLTMVLVADLGCLNIIEGSRNMGGTLLVAALAAGMFRIMTGALGVRRLQGGLFALVSALAVGAIGGMVYGGYEIVAAQGGVGEAARAKYETQAAGRFGLLLTSRIDFVAGLMAVRESPVIGYGSWARDEGGFMQQAYQMAEVPYNLSGSSYEFFNRIPTHSALLEAWVEHGLLATGFWWLVMFLVLRAYTRGAMIDRRWGLLAAIVIMWIGWNIIFSPFGGREIYAMAIAFLTLFCESTRRAGTKPA